MNRIRGHIKYPVIEKKEVPQETKTEPVINNLKPFRVWTQEEIEYLKKVYADTPVAFIAEYLKRTIASVSHQAHKLGITTSSRGSKSHRLGTANWGWRKGF
jgi:hypothetical protein